MVKIIDLELDTIYRKDFNKMIRHFFLDKSNTIISKSEQNLGLNPILHVGYGAGLMKSLIHFDITPIKKLIEDKTFANTDKLKFTLKLTNCFSVDGFPYEKDLIRGVGEKAQRAASFDLILHKLPFDFDAGRGFDFMHDMWVNDKRSFSKEGSNWYCCKNGLMWDGSLKPRSFKNIKGGIYTEEFMYNEYEKYLNNEDSIIIGSQHFDFGNENLSIDITKYVFEVINSINNINYGLCLSFSPDFESMETEYMQYVGFFNDHTNTFFHPYVEVEYDEYILDNRDSFTIGKDNRLYLYVTDDGEPINLDNIPTCVINENEHVVKQATKGVYYAEISASNCNVGTNTIEYDIWSKIALNGQEMGDVEMEFATNPISKKVKIGSDSNVKIEYVPSVYGINDDESINIGDVREITVDLREKYSTDKKVLLDKAEYRLYVKDGNREIDVINYHPIEKGFLNNFFMLYTEDLIPNQYYVDIKVSVGRETKLYKQSLRFKIISNVTERYQ